MGSASSSASSISGGENWYLRWVLAQSLAQLSFLLAHTIGRWFKDRLRAAFCAYAPCNLSAFPASSSVSLISSCPIRPILHSKCNQVKYITRNKARKSIITAYRFGEAPVILFQPTVTLDTTLLGSGKLAVSSTSTNGEHARTLSPKLFTLHSKA